MAGRYRRRVESEKIRQNDISADGVRRLFVKDLMCSAEEQVGVVAGEDV